MEEFSNLPTCPRDVIDYSDQESLTAVRARSNPSLHRPSPVRNSFYTLLPGQRDDSSELGSETSRRVGKLPGVHNNLTRSISIYQAKGSKPTFITTTINLVTTSFTGS